MVSRMRVFAAFGRPTDRRIVCTKPGSSISENRPVTGWELVSGIGRPNVEFAGVSPVPALARRRRLREASYIGASRQMDRFVARAPRDDDPETMPQRPWRL